MNVRDAQLRTCESWVVLPIVMGSAFGFHVWCCSSEDRLAVVVEKRTLRGIHRFEVVREKGTQPAYVSHAYVSCCICASSVNEWRTLTVLDGHSRAEWPVAPHLLHSRYGHVPRFWRCPDCAQSVQYFSHAELPVLCDSDPQLTQTIACVIR